MRRRLDLTGQRSGRLTVLRPAESIGGKPAWVCQCDCGREAVVKDHHLRYGQTKSCGCLHQKSKENPLGLTFLDGTCVELFAAKTVSKRNTSGVRGVYWMASKRVWRAVICFKGKRRSLGIYRNLEDAVKARKRAEEELIEPFCMNSAIYRAPAIDFRSSAEQIPTTGVGWRIKGERNSKFYINLPEQRH